MILSTNKLLNISDYSIVDYVLISGIGRKKNKFENTVFNICANDVNYNEFL